MKIRVVPEGALPVSFVIEAESAEEVLLLRNFCNWPDAYEGENEPPHLMIGNSGGNPAAGKYSFLLMYE